MIDTAILWLFAGSALVAAMLMLVLRHPMHVALALIATMLSLAGVYAMLGVHVIAVFQVLIYVGAVMVFMVYVIMLLDARDESPARRYSHLLAPAIVGLVALLAIVAHALWPGALPQGAAVGSASFGLKPFSIEFMNVYWLHFELASVLLVVAVVAALAVLEVGRRRHG